MKRKIVRRDPNKGTINLSEIETFLKDRIARVSGTFPEYIQSQMLLIEDLDIVELACDELFSDVRDYFNIDIDTFPYSQAFIDAEKQIYPMTHNRHKADYHAPSVQDLINWVHDTVK